MSSIRVLIVDDSAFIRKALQRMLLADPSIEVVGVARDGAEGVRLAAELHPDVVTLDVKMPVMDGLEALRRILADRPTPVLMLSSFTGEGAETTLQALELGALDFLDKSSVKSSMDFVNIGPALITKIKALAGIGGEKIQHVAAERAAVRPSPQAAAVVSPSPDELPYDLVCVGASTGGPSMLQSLLTQIPANYPFPIAIVQHMPPGFTRPLAERLDSITAVKVVEAADGEPLVPGKVVIAPAGLHMVVGRREGRLVARLTRFPESSLHRPSVDELFLSAARTTRARTVGVILTGMGKDGAQGMVKLRETGAFTIAQDERTSVVWGMPRTAVEMGGARVVLGASEIAPRLIELAAMRTA